MPNTHPRTIEDDGPATLGISEDKACFAVQLARRIAAKVPAVEPDPASNLSDDGFREVIEEYPDDPARQEFVDFFRSLNGEEISNLIALMWVGRGDYTREDWAAALDEAASDTDRRKASYLLETPLLASYLEEGLAQFGHSCADLERDRL